MKRLLLVLALAGFAVACGDDDDDDTSPDGGSKVDSGVKTDSGTGSIDSGTGGGGDAGPKVNAVTNAGAACTSKSDCTGSAPECKTMTALGTAYPGGLCTYVCKADVECGTGGACPFGQAASEGAPISATTTTQDCYKTCSAAADCRSGYTCATMRQVVQSNATLMTLFPTVPSNANYDKKVCVPAPASDAGTASDAGKTSDAGGVDAAS